MMAVLILGFRNDALTEHNETFCIWLIKGFDEMSACGFKLFCKVRVFLTFEQFVDSGEQVLFSFGDKKLGHGEHVVKVLQGKRQLEMTGLPCRAPSKRIVDNGETTASTEERTSWVSW